MLLLQTHEHFYLLLFAVQCEKGTFQKGNDCILCALGTYQPIGGQTKCLNCPAGYTTKIYGAINCTLG